jgi:uncharacterized membrane protein
MDCEYCFWERRSRDDIRGTLILKRGLAGTIGEVWPFVPLVMVVVLKVASVGIDDGDDSSM